MRSPATAPKRKAETPVGLEPRSKRVSFGHNLSPELFDKSLAPSTPLRKGSTPKADPPKGKTPSPKKAATPKKATPSPKKAATPKKATPSPKKAVTPKKATPSPKKASPKAKTPSPKKAVTPKAVTPVQDAPKVRYDLIY